MDEERLRMLRRRNVFANPWKPGSPYVHGIVSATILQFDTSPLFAPGETKMLKTGLSVTTGDRVLVCAGSTFSTRDVYARRRQRLHIPFVVVGEGTCIDIHVPVTNESSSPAAVSPDETLCVIVFGIPLPQVSVDTRHVFIATSERPSPRRRAVENRPYRVDAQNGPAGRTLRILIRHMRWARMNGNVIAATHIARLIVPVDPPTDPTDESFSSYEVKVVSDPCARVRQIEYTTVRKDHILIQLLYDATDPRAQTPPPESFVLTIHMWQKDARIFLRREAEPSLKPLSVNGFEVLAPSTSSVREGTDAQITIDNAYVTNAAFRAIFFPATIPGLSIDMLRWTPRKMLVISVSAKRDCRIERNMSLGRIHFFPEDSTIFKKDDQRPEALDAIPQDEILFCARSANGPLSHIEAYTYTEPPRRLSSTNAYDDRYRDEDDLDEEEDDYDEDEDEDEDERNERTFTFISDDEDVEEDEENDEDDSYGEDEDRDQAAETLEVVEDDPDEGAEDFVHLSLNTPEPSHRRRRESSPRLERPPRPTTPEIRQTAQLQAIRHEFSRRLEEHGGWDAGVIDPEEDDDSIYHRPANLRTFTLRGDLTAAPMLAPPEELEAERTMLYEVGPEFGLVRVSELAAMLFTLYTPILKTSVFFQKPGIQRVHCLLGPLKGKFINRPKEGVGRYLLMDN